MPNLFPPTFKLPAVSYPVLNIDDAAIRIVRLFIARTFSNVGRSLGHANTALPKKNANSSASNLAFLDTRILRHFLRKDFGVMPRAYNLRAAT